MVQNSVEKIKESHFTFTAFKQSFSLESLFKLWRFDDKSIGLLP